MNLPIECQNVMITYVGNVMVRDKYYDHYEKQKVIRRAFYSKSDGYYNRNDEWINTPDGFFHVPQYWQEWTWSDGVSSLMPHGFNHYGRVLPKDVIKWELCS